MNRDFLNVAFQGRTKFRDYLIGVILIFSITLIFTFCVIAIMALVTSFYGVSIFKKNGTDLLIYGNPFRTLLFTGAVCGGLFLGLFLAVERVHKRKFLTLINPAASISWERTIEGLIVSLFLWMISFPIWYLMNPSRYTIEFNASAWLPFALFVLLLLPIASLSVSLFYAYALQGLGLLTQNPIVISIVFALFNCLGERTIDGFILRGLNSIFMTWIILKDNRLELVIGRMAASWLISMLFISTFSSKVGVMTIIKIPDSNLPLSFNLISFVLTSALFYYICFGLWRKPKIDL
jgi:uncharacterized protein